MSTIAREAGHVVDRQPPSRRPAWLVALLVLALLLAGAAAVWSARTGPATSLWVDPAPPTAAPSTSPTPPVSPPSPAPSVSGSPRPGARGERAGLAVPGTRLLYSGAVRGGADLDLVASLGVRWLRLDAAWSEVEGTRGTYEWSNLDRIVGGARARGLSVVLILGTSAAWDRPTGTDWNHGPTNDSQRAGFAAFAAAAATRYRGQAAAYEIWNEPNLPGSWAPRPDPVAYLKLLSVAYRAIHQADPGATVLTGGTGGGSTGINSVGWYQRLYAAGLRLVCDGVAVHPYPDAPVANSGEMAAARRIRAVMDASGDTAKTLWGTETGVPTGGRPSVNEPQQAQLLRQLYDLWGAIAHTGPLLYYTLSDFDGTDREAHFGLLRTDRTAKPSYAALRAWVTQS